MIFKETYQKYNEEIKPDRALVEAVLERARSSSDVGTEGLGMRLARGFISALKPLAAVAAACLCILFTMPVLADAVPSVGQLLSKISPELAAYFIPVQLVDESQGIRMEVVAINVQEEETQVYITMQDLEGNRLDETTDLYDSYSLNIPFDCVSHCQKLDYDEETKTVTFLISIHAMRDADQAEWYEQIKNDRITFSVREIIAQKTVYEDMEIPIPLTEADRELEAMSTHLTGASGIYDTEEENLWDILDPRPSTHVLRPGEADERFPIEGIEFTGMGYVDGYLHIQLGIPNMLENDNHGYFFLKDREGNVRLYDGTASFFGTTEETKHIVYEECIFDISPKELSDYTLHGYFITSGLHLEGDWEVKFTLGQ